MGGVLSSPSKQSVAKILAQQQRQAEAAAQAAAEEQKQEEKRKKRRGRASLIATSLNGITDSENGGIKRKNLLGE